jgi:hypothetical protein
LFLINKPIGLLLTKDKKYYTDKNEQVIWNYFFTKNLDECINFITLYQPKTILIDTSVDHETILGCIAKIKYIYYPQNVETLNLTIGDIKNASILKIPISYALKGYPISAMERKMHDKLPPRGSTGKHNWTSVEDVGNLLGKIYNKECVSKQASEEMLLLLRQQERVNKIPKLIRENQLPVTIANKTGELNQVENDAAIITGMGIDDFIFVIMINNISYNENNKQQNIKIKKEITDNIAKIAMDLVDFFKK